MKRLVVGLVVIAIGMAGATAGFAADPQLSEPIDATEPIERASVEPLPEIGRHSVWVPDRLLQHSILFDGDSGEALGMIDSPTSLTPKALSQFVQS